MKAPPPPGDKVEANSRIKNLEKVELEILKIENDIVSEIEKLLTGLNEKDLSSTHNYEKN